MGTKFFEKYPEYEIVEKPSHELIDQYKDILPVAVIDFWKKYGFGSFMNGYLKIVNPNDYQKILDEAYDNIDEAIVIAITGLGDFIVWNEVEGWFYIVYFRFGETDALDKEFNNLFDRDLINDEILRVEFHIKDYYPARERLGELSFDECFGYVPILGAGGAEKPENLDKVGITEHIYLISQMMGKVED